MHTLYRHAIRQFSLLLQPFRTKFTLSFDLELYPNLVNERGQDILEICKGYGVDIILPDKGESNTDKIIIIGQDKYADAATKDIEKMVCEAIDQDIPITICDGYLIVCLLHMVMLQYKFIHK